MRRLMLLNGVAATVLVMMLSSIVWAQSPKKVMVVPFAIYANEDLSYLQKGIIQMLISRLSNADKVEVIQADPDMAKAANINEKAKSQGADFLVSGSLTLLGSSVSTDAKVMDLQQGKQIIGFNRTGKDQAAIIDHVDQLAAEMNVTLFGRKAPAIAPSVAAAPAAKKPEPSIYQHPEKLLTQPDGDRPGQLPGAVTNPNASLLMRGRRVNYQMRAVASGDVNGDGNLDIVCIGPSSVVVYGIQQQQFVKLAELKASSANYLGVDTFDLDGNGKAEIFVTSFDNRDSRANSFVLELDDRKLVRIDDNMNWFFRSLHIPGRGKVLAGQRQGVDVPFASAIHEIGRQGGSYGPVERLPLPRKLNLFGFAYGNVRTAHDTDIVAYNKGGFVQILNQRGEEEWTSSERYGGSHLFIELPNPLDRTDRNYVYLSPTIRLHDVDGDGLQEIFVIDNENTAGAFERVRVFKNGRLEALKWDDLGMTSKWRTRHLAKYISDFILTDVNGDGKPEVVASVVQKAGGIAFSKSRSYLAVFKFDTPTGKAQTGSTQ